MNDAELRLGIAEWFDSAAKVVRLLNRLDWKIFDYYESQSEPKNEVELALREVPKGKCETYGEWLDKWHQHDAQEIERDIQKARELISDLQSTVAQWLGDRLLLAFPALGLFEFESKSKGPEKQRYKFAWDRVLEIFETIEILWPMVREYAIAKRKFNHLRVCDTSPEDFKRGITVAMVVGAGVIRGATLEAIENRLFAEMAQVLRDLNSENHTQNPQNTPGNESPEPEIDTQNPQITDGLYRDQRRFVWCGESYDELSETMMDVLEVLHKKYPDKVFEEEITHKIGAIQTGGFWKWFRVNRESKQYVHPVKKIVCGRINTGIYLKRKQ